MAAVKGTQFKNSNQHVILPILEHLVTKVSRECMYSRLQRLDGVE